MSAEDAQRKLLEKSKFAAVEVIAECESISDVSKINLIQQMYLTFEFNEWNIKRFFNERQTIKQ